MLARISAVAALVVVGCLSGSIGELTDARNLGQYDVVRAPNAAFSPTEHRRQIIGLEFPYDTRLISLGGIGREGVRHTPDNMQRDAPCGIALCDGCNSIRLDPCRRSWLTGIAGHGLLREEGYTHSHPAVSCIVAKPLGFFDRDLSVINGQQPNVEFNIERGCGPAILDEKCEWRFYSHSVVPKRPRQLYIINPKPSSVAGDQALVRNFGLAAGERSGQRSSYGRNESKNDASLSPRQLASGILGSPFCRLRRPNRQTEIITTLLWIFVWCGGIGGGFILGVAKRPELGIAIVSLAFVALFLVAQVITTGTC